MGYSRQPVNLLDLPTPGYDAVEACRREGPIPEVAGPCKMVEAYCREKGIADGNIGVFCLPQFLIRQRFDFMFPAVNSKKVGIYCREQGGAIDTYCRNLLLRGYSVSPLTGKPLPAVNPDVLERCRLDNPIAGICSTPCERIDILCRQAGIYGYADGLVWPYCHLPLLQW